jgi:Tol biopolymer transport system component
MAVRFDPRRRSVDGIPVPVHDRVQVEPRLNGNSGIFVSAGGGLTTGERSFSGRLVWVSRDGTKHPVLPDVRDYTWVSLSPDGRRIAALVSDEHGSDVWIYDLTLSTLTRLTTLGTVSGVSWTYGGSDVLYTAVDGASNGIWSQPADGSAPPKKLFAGPDRLFVATLSPDGSSLLVQASRNSWDILRVPLDSTPVARPYVATPFDDEMPQLSPDGKWVAYQARETGQLEAYVRSYPDPSTKIPISIGEGEGPYWSADGRHLYYYSSSGHQTFLDARVSLSPTFRLLGRDTVASSDGLMVGNFGVSPDGKRVLAIERVASGYRVVISPNWVTELRRRLEANGGGSGKP